MFGRITLIAVFLIIAFAGPHLQAQPDRWQQRAFYTMDIDFDINTHRFSGDQRLVYQNNSPDTLYRVFYHLYFNAFQPNSMMDVRSRTIMDPDRRVADRIAKLGDEEIGYHQIKALRQNGTPVRHKVVGTILEVDLAEPILPYSSTVLDMNFESQVPLQIRRSGRFNREGIDYSMAQWYPKLCEYDYQGWHANPYIGREFYGVWSDFDVRITIDARYTIAATGYLQNADEIGHGYSDKDEPAIPETGKLTWNFFAPNVHDFVWAADPDYTHTRLTRKNGNVLHFFYVKNENTEKTWQELPSIMDRAFDFINTHFGQYQYRQYSFIQGGDGGMEYPMATLITGERPLPSLVGVSVHELMHSWYQMMLGTNESLYAWMDEGFTEYASSEVMNFLRREGLLPGEAVPNPHLGANASYLRFAQTGYEEPLSIHSDHFQTNMAYGRAAYTKGEVFLHQLQYIMGKETFDKAMLRYFDVWKFKHPNANDFIRIMEKESGLELDWFREYMVNTTHTVDYAVDKVEAGTDNRSTLITLARKGLMPMPLDVMVTYADDSQELFNIALQIMRGNKPKEGQYADLKYAVLEDWPWTKPTYTFTLPVSPERILKVEIDPSQRLVDADRSNNVYPAN